MLRNILFSFCFSIVNNAAELFLDIIPIYMQSFL